MFALDFGLEVYQDDFTEWQCKFWKEEYHSPETITLGYITLPSAHSEVRSDDGPGVASVSDLESLKT